MILSELENKKLALRMTLFTVGVKLDDLALDMFLITLKEFESKGEDFTIRDACRIKSELLKKHGAKIGYISFDVTDPK